MNKQEINKRLVDWFQLMIKKYPWISFKYEYSEKKGVYLVSSSPLNMIAQSEEFCEDSYNFSKKLYDMYKDATPLFCDDEDLFKLSDKAKLYNNFIYENIVDRGVEWNNATFESDVDLDDEDNLYLAA